MSEHDQPLAALKAELEKLRTTLECVRSSATPPVVSISDMLAESAPSPLAALPAKRTSDALRLIAQAEAALIRIRAALRLIEGNIATLGAAHDRAEAEIWQQRARRADATARLNRSERQLKEIQNSAAWKAVKPLWKLLTRSQRSREASSPAPSDFIFGIDAPTEWHISSAILVIRGWCSSRSGREIAGVRAKIGKKGRLGRYGLKRDNAGGGRRKEAARSGFAIEIPLPSGRSSVQLEAIVQGSEWEPFFRHEVERTGDFDEPNDPELPEAVQSAGTPLPRVPDGSAAKILGVLAPSLRKDAERQTTAAPFFSVITPTFNSKPGWIAEAALSLLQQSFSAWEWCIVDDGSTDRETRRLLEQLHKLNPRLRVLLGERRGISGATNQALDLARGDFVCFLDHDDLLAPDALQEIARKLQDDFDVIYSDEDKLDDRNAELREPFFKPDWSPEYFRGAMYVGHLLCVRRALAARVRFDSAFDGVQDFEFMLRVSEAGARIGHVPKVLYHWRKVPGSIAADPEAKPEIAQLQERAVTAHLQRLRIPARAEPSAFPHRLRIVPSAGADQPRVSIIIPTKDAPELLGRCLESIFAKTTYQNFEVILVDNGTTDPAAITIMQRHPVRRVDRPGRFNFSRANNQGAECATGSLLLFLNNDTEIGAEDWLEHLAFYAQQNDVGAAGALLLYPDETVQHAGIALGMRGTADHLMRGFPRDVDGYAGSLACAREVSAVTAACMMMRKPLFEELGGFNAHFFTAYQDLDLCLRLRTRGLRVIYTPQAVVVHHESASRKNYYDLIDRMLVLDQWEPLIARGDPYYNRNLDLERGDYSPARLS